MKRLTYVLFLLTLAFPTGAMGKETAPSAAEALRAAYRRLDAAYDRRDIPGIVAWYAPSFVYDDATGCQNLAQTRQRLMDDFQGTQSVTATTRIKSLVVYGDHAEAVVSRRVDMTLPKPMPNLPPPYFTVEVDWETWQHATGWRLTRIDRTPLQRTLEALDAQDQRVRLRLIADPKNLALVAQETAIDNADRARIKRIIGRYGWPGYDLVGTADAPITWEIVQHSDEDKAFQKRCLPLLQAAVRQGQAMPDELALLTDRILRGEGKPQIYGTQFIADTRGVWVPAPLEDPAHVDQRRASVGLGPLAEYAKDIRRTYQPSSQLKSPKPSP